MEFFKALVFFCSVVPVVDMPSTNRCIEKSDCACLPDKHGTLHSVCTDDIIDKNVNITFFLDTESFQPFEEVTSLPVTSSLYTMISNITVIGRRNGYMDLLDIPPFGCNLTQESGKNRVQNDDLQPTCLPKRWTCELRINNLKPRSVRVDLMLYDNEKKKPVVQNLPFPTTNDALYYFIAKELCEHETYKFFKNKFNERPKSNCADTSNHSASLLSALFCAGFLFCFSILAVLVSFIVYRSPENWQTWWRMIKGLKDEIKEATPVEDNFNQNPSQGNNIDIPGEESLEQKSDIVQETGYKARNVRAQKQNCIDKELYNLISNSEL